MIFKTVIVGPLGVNCSILGCERTREAVVVDPGADVPAIWKVVEDAGLTVKYILNTHGHFDHVGGNAGMKAKTGAELLIHQADESSLPRAAQVAAAYGLSTDPSPPADRYLEEGMTLSFGDISIHVIHTPGHTPGGVCLYIPSEKLVLTGDTLFQEGVGRTDLPGGSTETIISSITEKLLMLPEETVAVPGHGPTTTIGHEKRHNPYIRGGW